MASSDPLAIEKKNMRADAKRRRAAAFALHGTDAAQRIAAQGLDFLEPSEGLAVSGFVAIGDEIDPGCLLANLHMEGFRLCLPRIQGKGQPLLMLAWEPGAELEETMWSIREPLASSPAMTPSIVLVPLLAFDGAGFRLGYGGGFYDRTLARLRRRGKVTAVGLAYDELRVDAVPHSDYDERLDWVLAPSGPLRLSGA